MEIKPSDEYEAALKYAPHSLEKARRHFIKFYLDISYYLCVIPYKIVETQEGSYCASRFMPQQVICALIHITAMYDVGTFFRTARYSEVSTNPKLYFEIFMVTIHLTVISVFCYAVWRSSDKFCRLVHCLQRCPVISQFYPRWITVVMPLVTILYVILTLLHPILKERSWTSWEDLYNYHLFRGRYMLFMDHECHIRCLQKSNYSDFIQKTRVAESGFHFLNILIAWISFFFYTAQQLIIYHVDLIMNVMALVLWNATTFFTRILKQQHNCKRAMRTYEAIKTLSNLINDITGMVTLVYTVDSILYYSISLESLFTGNNWFANIVVIQFFLSSVSWLNFASTACLQMEKFREWVRNGNNRDHVSDKSIAIMLLLDEIQSNSVGLSGNGLFTINYKFVAQAITTLMTYFIIVIQFNK